MKVGAPPPSVTHWTKRAVRRVFRLIGAAYSFSLSLRLIINLYAKPEELLNKADVETAWEHFVVSGVIRRTFLPSQISTCN